MLVVPVRPRPLTRRRCAVVTVLLALLAVAGCGSSPGPVAAPRTLASPGAAAATRLDPAAFARAIAEPGRVTINVHVPYEGQLDGTDLSIPYDQIGAGGTALPTDRQTPLAVYCRTGRMSAVAVGRLTAMGYADVVELAGGMVAWQAAGLPVRT